MLKRVLPWVIFVALFILLIVGHSLKDNMNNYISKMMQSQASPEINKSSMAIIDSLYNYSANGSEFQLTFIEFGAIGCSACTRMEEVLEEIKIKYPQKVNVVFMNVLLPENQPLMKYYGIAAIPTQVLLYKNGLEYFRHTGYYSFEALQKEINTGL